MMLILTADEMMQKGLQLLGFDLRRQQKVGPKKIDDDSWRATGPLPSFMRRCEKICRRQRSQKLMTIVVHKCGMGPKLSSSSARTWPTGSTTTDDGMKPKDLSRYSTRNEYSSEYQVFSSVGG